MSYILKNLTRGDLFLNNALRIKFNGQTKVQSLTEEMKEALRKGNIHISSDVAEEAIEVPAESVKEVEIPVVEEVKKEYTEPIIEKIIIEPELENTEEATQPEVADDSPKAFNKNDYKNKFRK